MFHVKHVRSYTQCRPIYRASRSRPALHPWFRRDEERTHPLFSDHVPEACRRHRGGTGGRPGGTLGVSAIPTNHCLRHSLGITNCPCNGFQRMKGRAEASRLQQCVGSPLRVTPHVSDTAMFHVKHPLHVRAHVPMLAALALSAPSRGRGRRHSATTRALIPVPIRTSARGSTLHADMGVPRGELAWMEPGIAHGSGTPGDSRSGTPHPFASIHADPSCPTPHHRSARTSAIGRHQSRRTRSILAPVDSTSYRRSDPELLLANRSRPTTPPPGAPPTGSRSDSPWTQITTMLRLAASH